MEQQPQAHSIILSHSEPLHTHYPLHMPEMSRRLYRVRCHKVWQVFGSEQHVSFAVLSMFIGVSGVKRFGEEGGKGGGQL